MQQVTSAFLAEIRKSHTIVSYADVTTPTGKTFRLAITDGSVDVDRTADIRRRCTLTAIDPDGKLTPRDVDSDLTPFGTELRLYRGVKYTAGVLAGSEEVVPLGVFRLSKADVKDSVGGSPTISLEGYDYSRTVRRDKFTDTYTVKAGATVVQGIKDILARTLDDIQYDLFASTVTLSAPLVYDSGDDPWEAVQDLAQAAGCEVYFTATGRVRMAPPVDIDHMPAPAFTYKEGPGCTMTEVDVTFSDEPGFNGVVLVGESAGGSDTPPVRSVVWDNNPASVTYHLGPYGEVPTFITDSVVTTQAQADAAANAQLQLVLGFSYQLGITATVNPALDANDVIEVERERTGVTGKYAIDSLTIPLGVSGTSDINLRQKRVT